MSTEQRTKIPPQTVNMQEVITLTARLAQLLAEEVDNLNAMQVKKIEGLQQEKLFIINALEAHRKMIDKHPHIVDTIPSRDKEDLQAVVDVFEDILQENHRKLQLARAVNQKIVQTITEVVRETSKSRVYDHSGVAGIMGKEALSITLNQTA
jgi:hypothetical protein